MKAIRKTVFIFLSVCFIFSHIWNVYAEQNSTIPSNSGNTGTQLNKSAVSTPGTVQLNKVTSKSHNSLEITWKKVPGASGYCVYRKTGKKWKKIATVKSTRYLHKSSRNFPIKTGKTYTYTVKAFRKVKGTIIYGKHDKTGISGKTIPGTPSIVSGKYGTDRKITIQWKRVEGASGYIIYRKEKGAWKKMAEVPGPDHTKYTHASTKTFPIKEKKTYVYTVQAYTKTGNTLGKINKKGISVKAYNSGAAEVEKAQKNAKKIVQTITTPAMTKSQKLRKCFDWVMAKPYVTRRTFARTDGWTAYFANDHFVLGGGNCHSDACAFGYLARAIGYENVYVCTDTTGTKDAHSWTEVDGLYYDPLFAQAKSFSRYYGVKSFPLGVRTRQKID